MQRRHFLKSSSIAGGLLLFPEYRWLFPEPANFKPLRGNVGIYTDRGGTIGWLLQKNGVAVVDTQFPEQSQNLITQLKERSAKQVDLLINTHHHGDHSGGNIAFKGIVQQLVAHENSKANQIRVAKERDNEVGQMYPDTTFKDKWNQKVGDETISLHYFGAAHTNGDAVIHFENANVAHVGDLMFNRRFPYIDKSSGASIENWIRVIDTIFETLDDDTLFIFGHAGNGYEVTGDKEDLKAMQNYLEHLLEYATKAYQEGKTEAEASQGLEVIPGAADYTGRGIERSIQAAYQELSERN